MISVAPSPLLCQKNIFNIKVEHALDESGRHYLASQSINPLVVPGSAKAVEVLCLNKVYHGVGFRNQSGGLEFYNDSFSDHVIARTRAGLEEYRKSASRLRKNISSNIAGVSHWKSIQEKTTLRLIDLQTKLMDAQDEYEGLRDRYRQGSITIRDLNCNRKRLNRVIRELDNDIRLLEKERDEYEHIQRLLPLQKIMLTQLNAKITERSHEISVPVTATIIRRGLLTFRLYREVPTSQCCLFASFIDYLAYKTLLDGNYGFPLPCCDCIIMNSPDNFIEMMINSDEYTVVHCCFPNTMMGRTMEKTLMKRNPHAVSHSSSYAGMSGLFDYVVHHRKNLEYKKNKKVC